MDRSYVSYFMVVVKNTYNLLSPWKSRNSFKNLFNINKKKVIEHVAKNQYHIKPTDFNSRL